MLRHTEIACGKNIAIRLLVTEDIEGKITILIDTEKSELKNIEITCLDAGVPGVVGPHISFGVGDVVSDICHRHVELSQSPWSQD